MKICYIAQQAMILSEGQLYHIQRGNVSLPSSHAVKLLKATNQKKRKKKLKNSQ